MTRNRKTVVTSLNKLSVNVNVYIWRRQIFKYALTKTFLVGQ